MAGVAEGGSCAEDEVLNSKVKHAYDSMVKEKSMILQ